MILLIKNFDPLSFFSSTWNWTFNLPLSVTSRQSFSKNSNSQPYWRTNLQSQPNRFCLAQIIAGETNLFLASSKNKVCTVKIRFQEQCTQSKVNNKDNRVFDFNNTIKSCFLVQKCHEHVVTIDICLSYILI